MKEIVKYLDELIPNPKCELNYTKDYELLLATMLSAQTTDKRVNMVTAVLFKKYPTLESIRNANVEDIKIIIKSLGTYNKKALNIIEIANKLKLTNDIVPNDRNFLEKLPGVGRKTTNVVLSNIFDVQCIAVDTHIHRVSIRIGLVNKNSNVYETEMILTDKFKNYNLNRIHHQLLLFGRYYCTAKKPKCYNCKLKNICKKVGL